MPWRPFVSGPQSQTIAEICAANGVPYSNGCGCYKLTTKEKISAGKMLLALNGSTGDVLEGAAQVRATLKLGGGDLNISAKDIPPPWFLFVNSTSANRGIPPNSSVMIQVAGAVAGSKSAGAAAGAAAAPPAAVVDKPKKVAVDKATALQAMRETASVAASASQSGWRPFVSGPKKETIPEICAANGVQYSNGCGCYKLTTKEKISAGKMLLALNGSTGDVLEGAAQVRATLKLGGGDLNISAKDIPPPWFLFVNSTSGNRGIPPNSSVMIHVGGAPPSGGKTTKQGSSKKRRRDEDDDDDEGNEDDDDQGGNDGEEPTLMPVSKHDQMSKQHCAEAVRAIQEYFQVQEVGDYILFHVPDDTLDPISGAQSRSWRWPRCYAMGESLSIMGVLCVKPKAGKGKPPKIVGMQGCSYSSDETITVWSSFAEEHFDALDTLEFKKDVPLGDALQGNLEETLEEDDFHCPSFVAYYKARGL